MSFGKRHLAAAIAVGGLLVGSVGVAAPAGAAGHVVAPGQSIQAAIDAASPGDTIVLQHGVYQENIDVTVDDLTIVGNGATLKPPATPAPTACSELFGSDLVDGVCIAGVIDPDTFEPITFRADVRIIGLRVTGFSGTGINAIAASGLVLIFNTLTDNADYGAAAFSSTGTRMIANRVSGSLDAGLYLGDSPDANAAVIANVVSNNNIGIFQRNAEGIRMIANRATGNCLGILVLADAPGPAGNSQLTGNVVSDNTKVCPPTDESPDPTSGLGVVLFGAHDVTVRGNFITGNVLGDPLSPSGGVVVMTGFGGTVPTNNVVTANFILGNEPDILWDEAGTGNVFRRNFCRTSDPDGLC